MLMPSTITALRTRGYDSTWYIPGAIHGVENAHMDGGGRYTFQPPNVSRSIRLRGPIYLRRLHRNSFDILTAGCSAGGYRSLEGLYTKAVIPKSWLLDRRLPIVSKPLTPTTHSH